jgi:decaprenylphospho-beta-D-erythro-pentofuranosid-2-ulose 2-reductase
VNDALGVPHRILLLGGTSEIGLAIVRRALARRRGEIVVAARPSTRASETAQALRDEGHEVVVVPFDAADTPSHHDVVEAAFAGGDVDLAIVAFGVLGDQPRLLADAAAAVELVRVNYLGAVSVGLLLAARLRAQGHGAILALSSVAGERPRRSNFVYGSSKAGLDAFFTGLADELHGTGVSVTVLRPGFVRSRMTAGLDEAPLATDPDAVAEVAVGAVARRAPVAWAPAPLRWVMAVLRHLPRALFRRLDL